MIFTKLHLLLQSCRIARCFSCILYFKGFITKHTLHLSHIVKSPHVIYPSVLADLLSRSISTTLAQTPAKINTYTRYIYMGHVHLSCF